MTPNWISAWLAADGKRRFAKNTKGLFRRLLRTEQLEQRYMLTGSTSGSGGGSGSGCGGGGDPGTAEIRIDKIGVLYEDESNVEVFKLTRVGNSGPATLSVNVSFSTDTTGTDYAEFSGDYGGIGSTSMSYSFGAGELEKKITLSGVIDNDAEGASGYEFITATITSATSLTCGGNPTYKAATPSSATTELYDGTRTPAIVTVEANVDEIDEDAPGSATFTFTRTGPPVRELTVYYSISGSAASSGTTADYSAAPGLSGFIVIDDGDSDETITITAIDDSFIDSFETVTITVIADQSGFDLYNPGLPNSDTVLIIDADSTPSSEPEVSISGPVGNVTEGDDAVFTISIVGTPSATVTVPFSTVQGTALSPGDYTHTTGSVTFGPTDTAPKTFAVPTIRDGLLLEGLESFLAVLHRPTNAVIDVSTAQATIEDRVPPFYVYINNVSVQEPVSGYINAVFTVSAFGTTGTMSLDYTTVNGTATTSSSDYNFASGTLYFSAGESTQQITVQVLADSVTESIENFTVELSVDSGNVEFFNDTGVGLIIDRPITDGDLDLILEHTTYACSCNCCGGTPIDPKEADAVVIPDGLQPQPIYRGDGTLSSDAIFNVKAEFDPDRTLNSADVRIKVNGTWQTPVSYHGGNTTVDNWLVFTQMLDLSGLPSSGGYPVEIEVTANYADGSTVRDKSGFTYILDKESESPFGPRWHLPELDRLALTTSGSYQGAALITGAGVGSWFAKSGSDYLTPKGTFASLESVAGGFELVYPTGESSFFNADGLLISRKDRNLNATTYAYIDADGDSAVDEIETITDPFGRTTTFAYSSGHLDTITDFAGRVTSYTYTGDLITTITHPDPDGAGGADPAEEHFTYNGDGRLTEHEDGLARVTEFEYDVGGRLETITLPDNETRQVSSLMTLGLKQGVTSGKQNPLALEDLKATLTDGRGNTQTVRTDDFGNHLEVMNEEGVSTLTERDEDGLPTRIVRVGDYTHPDRVTQLFHNSDGQLTRLINSDLTEQRWEYDPISKQPSKYIDELGRVTEFRYDVFGNLLRTSQTLSGHTLEPNSSDTPNQFQRNFYNMLDVNSSWSISGFDLLNVMNWLNLNGPYTYVSGPAGDGQLRDTNGSSSITSLDALMIINYNNLYNPLVTTSYTYTSSLDVGSLADLPKGLPLTMTDPLGRVTVYTYETNTADQDFGRLRSITEAYGLSEAATTTFDYDAAGNLTSVVDPLGRETRSEYDNLDRLLKVIQPHPTDPYSDGPTTEYEYDAVGNIVSMTDPMDYVTTYDYDPMNRLEKVTEPIPVGSNPADAPVTELAYDENGNLASITDPLNRTTTYSYDDADRLEETEYANGTKSQLQYNLFGEVEAVITIGVGTGSSSSTTSYTYDNRGRLRSTTLPSTSGVSGSVWSESYTYDAAGQLISFTDRLVRTTDYKYDSLGRLASTTLPEPSSGAGRPVYRSAYDRAGNLRAQIDPLGNFTEWRYDGLNRPIQVREMDPDGTEAGTPGITSFTYDAASQLTQVLNPRNKYTTYQYDLTGRITQVTDANYSGIEGITAFEYDAAGNVIETTDPLGRVVTLAYDRLHRLISESGDTDPVTFGYDKAGQLRTVTDGLSRVTTYDYDSVGRIASILYPAPGGGATQPEFTYLYEDLGTSSKVRVEDNASDGVTRTYNAWGLLISEDHEGSITSYGYNEVGNLTTLTDPMSRVTSFDYDDLDRLIFRTDPDPDGPSGVAASKTGFEYDFVGNLLKSIDPRSKETSFTYDNRYRRIASKDPLDGETLFEYDDVDNLTKLTDPVGNATTWQYDIRDRVTQETNALYQSRNFEYDAASNLTKRTDRLGRVILFDYDDMNRAIREEWWGEPSWSPAYPEGSISTSSNGYRYDEVQIVGFYDSTAFTSGTFTLTYDGQTTAAIAWDATAGAVETALEALSNLAPGDVSVVKNYDYTTQQQWQITFTGTMAGTDVAQITIDASSVVNGVGAPTEEEWTYTGGSAGDEVQTVYLNYTDLGTFTLTYDGQTTGAIAWDASTGAVETALEALSNIDDVSVSGTPGSYYTITFGGTLAATDVDELTADFSSLSSTMLKNVLTFEYDAAGQLEFAGDQFAEYEYGYDGMGRLLTETQNIVGLPEIVFENAYNVKSGRTSLAASIGGTDDFLRTYTRDEWNRVTEQVEAGQGGGNGVVRKEVDFAYNAAHQYESITRYEGTSPTLIATTSFAYDDMGRLDDLHHTNSSTTLARYQYVFDLASRIEQITSYVAGVSDYVHDDTNQLLEADHDGSGPPDEDYEYDANGNRNSSGFDVDPNNQIATDGTYNYTYDAEGNRATKTLISTGESETYAWDHRNRLVSITFEDGSSNVVKAVDQTYDVWDQWIKRTVDPDGAGIADAVDTYFAYESGQITFQWEDTDGAGGSAPAMSHRYNWADSVDHFLADEQISTPGMAGNTLWGLGDHLGTQRDILDLSGGTVSVVNHRDYNSFGSLTSETNSAIDLIFGYTSRPWDEASDLQNNLRRWLDVLLQRWMSEDPIGIMGGDSNYSRYVNNSPLDNSDPTGQSALGKVLREAVKEGSEAVIKNHVKKEIREKWYQFIRKQLSEAGLGELYQVHHIIVQRLFKDPALAKFFDDIDVLRDCSKNTTILPTKQLAQTGADIGQAALHQGKHIEDYDKLVEAPLRKIMDEYNAAKLTDAAKAKATAAAKVRELQKTIRSGLQDGSIRLHHYDTPENRQEWLTGAAMSIMALAMFSGATEAEAEELAMGQLERIVENETYYRQKNVIIRYGTASYYTKDCETGSVARWATFAVDFFNPVEDVMFVTDLIEDGARAIYNFHEDLRTEIREWGKDLKRARENLEDPSAHRNLKRDLLKELE